MTFKPPLLVAAPTRCGTTMVTWLLHLHGAWIGEAKLTKAPETNPAVGTENIYVKKYLKRCGPMPHDFKERMADIAQGNSPWVIKTVLLLEKWELFKHHYPTALWILPTRPLEDIVASKMRHPGMAHRGEELNRSRTERHIALQQKVMDACSHWYSLDCDLLMTGDEAYARDFVEFAGFDFSPEIFRKWLQPERWHNGTE